MNKSFVITKEKPLSIFIEDSGRLSIHLAAVSFFRDITALSSCPKLVDDECKADIVIKYGKFSHIEEYSVDVKENKITILGNDDLGVIFGIYAFEEEVLKISPSYLMEGLVLERKDIIPLEEQFINNYPQTRFRGWFVNDEDLLSGFKTLGKRELDYEFYNDIIHPEMMDKIAETALRFKMNLIIPSTLIDITNPYEDMLLEVCSNRGLYISQHHIEPLGVSKFGFAKFAKERNLDDGFSYVSNRENLIKCWEYYIKQWSKYPRVIFQAGLRGGTDRPVWSVEKNLDTPESRGDLISSAINEQYELVKKIYPYDVYMTSTLWMEGADLLNDGYLHLNKNISIIFSDIGMSQLFGNDFFNIKRDPNVTYGLYYHAGYWHTGPHLAEGVLPKKMSYCYRLLDEYKSNYYSMLNVANIKDLIFSLYMNSKMTWNNCISVDEIYNQYAKLYFEGENVIKFINAIKTYYSSLGDVGEDQYERFCKKYNFSYRKYEGLDFPVVSMNDGMFKAIIYSFYYEGREEVKTPQLRKVCVDGLPLSKQAYKEFLALSNELPRGYVNGFNQHWTFESLFFSHIYQSGLYLYDATELLKQRRYDEAEKLLKLSSEELVSVLEERKIYFTGEYKDWFNDERKINIKRLSTRVLEDLDRAKEVQEKIDNITSR